MRKIKDMKVEEGKRVWLCAWDGAAEDGKAWADSWEPTANVSEDLRQDFFQERIESASRVKVAVDVAPLDEVVQRRMSMQAMKEQGDLQTAFGAVYVVPIEELALKDLAAYYISTMAARYKVPVDEAFDPKTKVTTVGLRLKVKEAGEFCSFERLPSAKLTGIKNLRFNYGRKHDSTVIIIPVIYLRYKDNTHLRGTVNFELEYHTCKINGITGNLTPPHLVTGLLKGTTYKNETIEYARAQLQHVSKHPLIKLGWHNLPKEVWALADGVCMPDHCV